MTGLLSIESSAHHAFIDAASPTPGGNRRRCPLGDDGMAQKMVRSTWPPESPLNFRSMNCMLICMQSTSVRIDVATHEELKRLAADLNTTVGNTVSLAVRALRQDRMGGELSSPLRDDETAWLDADLG